MFLPGESQGPGSLVGCPLWGHTETDTTERPHNKHLSFGEAMLMFDQPQGGAVTVKIKAGGMSQTFILVKPF